MDTLSFFLCTLLLVILLLLSRWRHGRRGRNNPPSPSSYPLLGHLPLLKKPVHRSLAGLAASYGPVVSLCFGSQPVLLVTSIAAAQECFSKNDIVFANRPRLLAGEMLGYDYSVLFWAPYGPRWHNLRRFMNLEIFSTARLQTFVRIREEEVAAMVKDLALPVDTHEVTLRPRLFGLALNIMMGILCGKRYYGNDAGHLEEAKRLEEIVQDTMKLSGSSNLGDFLPIVRRFGPSGLQKKLKELQRKRDSFLQSLLDHYRNTDNDGRSEKGRKSVLDALVKLQQEDPKYYNDDMILGMMMTMVTAGTDTSVATIEWAMAELLSQPKLLAKAREELDATVGRERMIKEADLASLPFLGQVIEETLRLHPASPIVPAHYSSDKCTVGGFDVPGGTMLLVNAWAIHRDPEVWDEPARFKPERFEKVEKRPESMMTFGLGRRRCPGEVLAMRVVGLALGGLIHCLDWDHSHGEVDLSEGEGITMPMANPLHAVCKPREGLASLLRAAI